MTDPAAYVAAYLAPWSAGGWPFDVGDDPSFESSAQHRSSGGRLSWGVCRADLRNRVARGDLVVFVAAEKSQQGDERLYRLAGWATVAEKVSQVDVWEQPRLEPYRHYRNLLIASGPDAGDYLHHELDAPWHQDWLWRLGHASREAPKKSQWVAAGRDGRLKANLINVGSWRVRPAPNYVLFETEDEGTCVLADPPTVATEGSRGAVESWLDYPLAVSLRRLLLSGTKRAGLRTTNPQQPHRHIRLNMPAHRVRRDLTELCSRHNLESRWTDHHRG